MVEGQRNLIDAVERKISFKNPDGREYKLNEETATLVVRPRGWHLVERHLMIDGTPDFRRGLRLRSLRLPQREAPARARERTVFLSAEDGEPQGGAPVEQIFDWTERELDLGSGTIKRRCLSKSYRSLSRWRKPLRAPRSQRRPERGPLGLHVQHHQEARRPKEFILRTARRSA